MAREWLLRGVDPEELKPTPKDEGPQTPRSRWENFWYHHKWKFWLAVFVVMALTIATVQMVTRNDPDYYLLLLTEERYTPQQLEGLEALLAPYGDDLDGDGEVEVYVGNCTYTPEVDSGRDSDIQQVQAHLMLGDRMLFIFEPKAYQFFQKTVIDKVEGGMDFFTTLPEEQPGLFADGKLWNWEKDPRPVPELKERSKKLYFGVRKAGGTATNAEEMHRDCLALLERFIADQKPTKS